MVTVVGGTYFENCINPIWDNEFYGSGGRAAAILAQFNTTTKLATYIDPRDDGKRASLAGDYKFSLTNRTPSKQQVYFDYFHDLEPPRIYPPPESLKAEQARTIQVQDDVVLRFGMLEGTGRVKATYAVYDPQNSLEPEPFFDNGSEAENVVIVCNEEEVIKLSQKKYR